MEKGKCVPCEIKVTSTIYIFSKGISDKSYIISGMTLDIYRYPPPCII